MILCSEGALLALPCRGVCHVYHVHCFYFGGKLLLSPGAGEASLFFFAVTWRPLPFVFGIELASLFENPTISVGMVGGFFGAAMDLTGPIQYFI